MPKSLPHSLSILYDRVIKVKIFRNCRTRKERDGRIPFRDETGGALDARMMNKMSRAIIAGLRSFNTNVGFTFLAFVLKN